MYKIMIVDDEIISQDILQKYIERKMPNCQITAICTTGKDALESFQKEAADIILTDIRMPIMDGLQLLENLSKLSNNYVPIIISSYSDFEYAKKAMQLGVVHYLLKPIDFSELNQCLEAAIHNLNCKRLAFDNYVPYDDGHELFFTNLILGHYKDDLTAKRYFNRLHFPFSYETCQGVYLQISFTKSLNWNYGTDAIFTAFHNLIYMLNPMSHSFILFRKEDHFACLIVCENPHAVSLTALKKEAFDLLEITVDITASNYFETITELSQNVCMDIAEENMDTDIVDIEERIKDAICYMQIHYAEDLSRETVAAKIFMSGAYFSRCFKLVTHTTYKDFLTEIRINKAKDLLKTNTKIQDISMQVGYSNTNRFIANFKQYTSYTPSEYRSKVLKLF